MTIRSPLLALLLALTLVVTAQSAALARTQNVPAGAVVICTGGGLVTIEIDAEGKPTGPAHVCPDAVASLAAPSSATPEVARPTDATADAAAFAALPAPRGHGARAGAARDPPRHL
ncbi:hypothetical protein [Rhodosalinus sp.]|uniref:hypothetical protein n=1 Tax=Rhodosalinus sp. TaxID=2047741 RepID=UPI00397BA57C